TRDAERLRDWGIAPSVRLGLGTPTEVTLSALLQRNRDLPDYGFPFVTSNGTGTVRKPVQAPANVFYGYSDDRFNQSVNLHTVTTGVEIAREESREDRYVWNTSTANASINLGNPLLGPRSGERALSRTVTTTADMLVAYVNDELALNAQWKLIGGVRGERFKASSDLQKYTLPSGFPADTTAASVPKSEAMWSPRAGV